MIISRETAKAIADKIEKYARDVYAEHGLTYVRTSTKFGGELVITLKGVDTTTKASGEFALTAGRLKSGLASAGDIAYAYDKEVEGGGEWLPVIILESKRTKYVFRFKEDEEDRLYQAPYEAFSFLDPGVPLDNPYEPTETNYWNWEQLHDWAYKQKPDTLKSIQKYVDLMYFDNGRSQKQVVKRLKEIGVLNNRGAYVLSHPLYNDIQSYIADNYL